MTGPEHYAEAERLIHLADEVARVHGLRPEQQQVALAAAQVSATLALAAATAEAGDLVRWDDRGGPTDWYQAITGTES